MRSWGLMGKLGMIPHVLAVVRAEGVLGVPGDSSLRIRCACKAAGCGCVVTFGTRYRLTHCENCTSQNVQGCADKGCHSDCLRAKKKLAQAESGPGPADSS
jgi:hypothetical protein